MINELRLLHRIHVQGSTATCVASSASVVNAYERDTLELQLQLIQLLRGRMSLVVRANRRYSSTGSVEQFAVTEGNKLRSTTSIAGNE